VQPLPHHPASPRTIHRVSEAGVGNYTTRVVGPMEYIVVLVTSGFRYLVGAPKVRWQAGAEAFTIP
jgi:hypothetical protein